MVTLKGSTPSAAAARLRVVRDGPTSARAEVDELGASSPLLPRVASGDAGAVRQFVERYGALVWSLCRRASSTQEDAEDAVQEIFLDVWRSASKFDPSLGSEVTYVAMIARRRLIDRRRQGRRRPPLEPEDMLAAPAIDDVSERAAEVVLAGRVLDVMRPEQRRVLQLSLCQDLSHNEIARELKMPLGTVKAHARRGILHLKRALFGDSSAIDGSEAEHGIE